MLHVLRWVVDTNIEFATCGNLISCDFLLNINKKKRKENENENWIWFNVGRVIDLHREIKWKV